MKTLVATILLVLFPACLYCLPSCDKLCSQNQVYSSNVSSCQATCWRKKFHETTKCSTSPGCMCSTGYLRHPDTFECIPESLCPKKTNHAQCGKNEIYLICTSNTTECEKLCSSEKKNSKSCPCKNQCVCKKGYARSSLTFQCIHESQCENCPVGYKYDAKLRKCSLNCINNGHVCPKNQTYLECGSKCKEQKCSIPKNEESIVCTQCVPGCYCDHRNGYKRDLVTNKCILSKECTVCPENEKFMCGNPLCERTCATIDEKCTKKPLRCEYKCYCEDKYVRAFEDSQCVSELQCPVVNNKDIQSKLQTIFP